MKYIASSWRGWSVKSSQTDATVSAASRTRDWRRGLKGLVGPRSSARGRPSPRGARYALRPLPRTMAAPTAAIAARATATLTGGGRPEPFSGTFTVATWDASSE